MTEAMSALLDRAADAARAALYPTMRVSIESMPESHRKAWHAAVLAVARVILTAPPSRSVLEVASDAYGEGSYDVVVDALAALRKDG